MSVDFARFGSVRLHSFSSGLVREIEHEILEALGVSLALLEILRWQRRRVRVLVDRLGSVLHFTLVLFDSMIASGDSGIITPLGLLFVIPIIPPVFDGR